jgi:hypothetical protein
MPYNPPNPTPFRSPSSRPTNITSPRVQPPQLPPNVQDQDGRASTRYGVEAADMTSMRRTDGRSDYAPANNATPGNGLGPPPAYQLDGRDG